MDTPKTQAFRRKGLVRAQRLEQERTWQLKKGTRFTAQAGDWWVWSGDDESDGRSVVSEEFEATYRRTSRDGVFQRVGRVEARRLVTPTPVTTLEGDDVGQPGEWLVTDELGNSWCVPDKVFRNGYEPA